jgi:glutaredoxin
MLNHVNGTTKHQVRLYALSTCGWCRKTKNLLDQLDVAYDYEDVDLLDDKEAERASAEMRRWNPSGSFPLVIIDNLKVICGFMEDELRRELA